MLRRCLALFVFALSAACASGVGCQTYDSPPRASIDGLADGILTDPSAPLVVRFSEPVDPKTLKLEVVKLVTDREGNLGDEDKDPATALDSIYAFTATSESGGVGELSADKKTLTIKFEATPPTGPALAVLIEPGLKDADGNEQKVRDRVIFSYKFSCEGSGATTAFPSGAYFFIVDVEEPIETQIQLYANIAVDETTGAVSVAFANADRNPDPNRCSPACESTEACRLLPSEQCVVPSTKAGNADEFPDYIVNIEPPTGYSFDATGCVAESDGGVVRFANAPTDVTIQSPAVTVVGIELSASFAYDAEGVFRGSGSLTSPDVEPLHGAGSGTMTARLLKPEEVPAGLPEAP